MEFFDRPDSFVVVNRLQLQLEHILHMVDDVGADIEVATIHNSDPMHNDATMVALPAGSIMIDATGMAKAPQGRRSVMPVVSMGGIAWEFNYCVDLKFIHQA